MSKCQNLQEKRKKLSVTCFFFLGGNGPFTTIVGKKDLIAMVPFPPPALHGFGMALAKLHRHGDALEKAKEGLNLLPSYHLQTAWPGIIAKC